MKNKNGDVTMDIINIKVIIRAAFGQVYLNDFEE